MSTARGRTKAPIALTRKLKVRAVDGSAIPRGTRKRAARVAGLVAEATMMTMTIEAAGHSLKDRAAAGMTIPRATPKRAARAA